MCLTPAMYRAAAAEASCEVLPCSRASMVLTLEGTRVKAMIAFMRPDLFARFGLPDALDDPDHVAS